MTTRKLSRRRLFTLLKTVEFDVAMGDDTFALFNPLRSQPRQRSDVAHELSHLLLKHDLTEVREVAGVPFRTCRADQEEEATTLGGTLLLPRPLVVHAVGQNMSIEYIARRYGVTEEMARFRVNTTGAIRQIDRRRSSLSAKRGPSTE
jgi:Zn-dependent peptidase ImmA (M78 family)